MHTLGRKAPSVSNRTSFLQATGVQRLLLFHITGGAGARHTRAQNPFSARRTRYHVVGYVSAFEFRSAPLWYKFSEIVPKRLTLLRAVIFFSSNRTQIASCFFLVYNGTEPGRCPADLIDISDLPLYLPAPLFLKVPSAAHASINRKKSPASR